MRLKPYVNHLEHDGPGSVPISIAIEKAMSVVKTVLSNTRNPQIASSDHSHTYDDKYTLAETVTALGMTSLLNTLEQLGMEKTTLQRLVKSVQDEQESVTIRISAKDKSEFLREEEIKIESPSVVEEKKKGAAFQSKSRKVVTKVKQYHWRVEIEYTIHVFCGTDSTLDQEKSAVLKSNRISCDVTTRGSKESPLSSEKLDSDVSLTWLLQHVNKETLDADFSIDRDLESCRTPARNQNIEEASESLRDIKKWFSEVNGYFKWRDQQMERFTDPTDNIPSLSNSIKTNQMFVPVLPIFDAKKEAIAVLEDDETTSTTPSKSSPVLSSEDIKKMLELQSDSISKAIETVSSRFSLDSSKGKASRQLMTSTEATIVLLSDYIGGVISMWLHGIDHIEEMLYSQLHDAIGKEVDSKDLSEFVRFHNQRLFSDRYAPEEFCYAIRRPEHYPDGMIGIEEVTADKDGNILTFTRKLENNNDSDGYPMYIPINSATSIEFKGDMFLHAWLLQRFQDKPTFQLAARARQFSSFMLLIGKLSGPDTFEPEHGIILKNKDEVLIPLILNETPSAKEFKDAIESLSPEQQRFAKSFRNMKLSSSVFGVCVVQLKPQLELLLGLPETSLTKEIRLTQDLLNLFIDYQIPSDLLSYDGPEDASNKEKVDIVKQHVKNVLDMINVTKEEELEQAKEKAKMSQYSAQAFHYEEEFEEECDEDDFGGGFDLFGSASEAVERCARYSPPPGIKTRGRVLMTKSMSKSTPPTNEKQIISDTTNAKDENNTSTTTTTPSNSQQQQQQLGRNNSIDLTAIPKHLDQKFEKFSKDETYGGALRSTTIKTGDNWTKKSKPNLLSEMKSESLSIETQRTERNRTFDLLDALSRSGSLALQDAELHVMVASSQCFEKSVVDTVVKDNINPIEKIERSNLIVAQVVHDVHGSVAGLLRNEDDIKRIGKASPLLLQDMV